MWKSCRVKLEMWQAQLNHRGVGNWVLLSSCVLSWVVQEDKKDLGKKVSLFLPSPMSL